MSHVSVRTMVVAVIAATVSVAVGGSSKVEEPQPEPVTRPVVAPYVPPKIDPSTLHGEIPNQNPNMKWTTLGVNEGLVEAVSSLVRQIDPLLDNGQVQAIAEQLVYGDIRALTSDHTDLNGVNPGVRITVERYFADEGPQWRIVDEKYTGLNEEGPK